MAKLADEFVAMGHSVTVVTSVPHYDTNKVWPEYSQKLVYTERRDSMKIHRLRPYVADDKSSILKRLFGYASFNLLSILRGLSVGKHDVILVCSPPLTNGIIADVISRLTGAPFIYNVQDIWPDVAIRAGVLKSERLIRVLRKMEAYVYRRASRLAVISHGFRRNLEAKGVPSAKLAVISNFIDFDLVTPTPKNNDFRRKHQLENKFVVIFAGNMGFSQGLEVVLDAAKLLEGFDGIEFLMVGNGASKAKSIEYCEKLRLRNVRFLPFQPQADLPAMYGTADVCLIPLRRGFTTESVPCKLYTIMASGKPAVAAVDQGSDTANLLSHSRCGVRVEPEDARALADAILAYYTNPEARHSAGESGRRFVLQHFEPRAIAKIYLQTLQAAAGNEWTQEVGQELRVAESD